MPLNAKFGVEFFAKLPKIRAFQLKGIVDRLVGYITEKRLRLVVVDELVGVSGDQVCSIARLIPRVAAVMPPVNVMVPVDIVVEVIAAAAIEPNPAVKAVGVNALAPFPPLMVFKNVVGQV